MTKENNVTKDTKFADLPKPEEGKRWTRNLMSEEWVQIDIDTPISCDPGSETYWSM